MLHTILTILRIIGIILLVLLGILLTVLLLLLFVPLRYRLHVRKEEVLEADGRVTWLFHFVRLDLRYSDLQGDACLKILGFRLKQFHFLKRKEDRETKEPEPETFDPEPEWEPEAGTEPVEMTDTGTAGPEADEAAGTEATETTDTGPDEAAETEPVEMTDTEAAGPAADEAAGMEAIETADTGPYEAAGTEPVEMTDTGTAGPAADEAVDTEAIETTDTVPDEGAGTEPVEMTDTGEAGPAADEDAETKSGIRAKLAELAARFANLVLQLLLQVPGLPAEVYEKIDSLSAKLDHKSDGLHKKIDPLLTAEAEHMLGKVIRYLLYLLRGYAPRKITGYLHFGTGKPDLTGKLTGLIYVLLPKGGSSYEVDPDFYEAVLRTDTSASGHIRAYRAAWVAVRLLTDREFWHLLRAVRGRDKKEKRNHRNRKKKK